MEQEDYPTDFEEFIVRFTTENDCLDYIASLRWPDGFICPRCKSSKSWKTACKLIHCAKCGYETSIIAGTLFQDTRKPLRLWLHVMWWVMSQKTDRDRGRPLDYCLFLLQQTQSSLLDDFPSVHAGAFIRALRGISNIYHTKNRA